MVDQGAQPHRQDVPGEAEAFLKFAEAADAHQGVANDQ